ncbi:hypothetical protein PCANC_13611 [Puccinia coronata f. sp. avenae]|uniref:C2H2-type domain-containing protein n=1 Tax=Puccinia coronata f. sp. avenae TaxID=200324 RepID=A0A2N5UKT5_9BASI|nr:hypothetical protein PCANC_13611 [Puccinia coronata f. sp. avenae]
MASAACQASFTEENLQYTDDIKPTLAQRTDSNSNDFLFPSYPPLCPIQDEHEPSPVSYEASPPKHENPSIKYESQSNYDSGEQYPFLSFTPASILAPPNSSPVESTTPHLTHVPNVTTSTQPFPCSTSSQVQLPPLLNSRQEYPSSTWIYQPTYEQSRSPAAEVFYGRERSGLSHCLRLNHRSSSLSHYLPGPYSPYTPEYSYPTGSEYDSLNEFRFNECRPNPHRILYPQAIYPTPGVSPYSRPPQHSTIPSERPFPCDKCGARFNRNHDLKRHTRIHLEVKPFPCGWCDKAFSRKDALKRHLMVKACSGSKEVSVEESVRRAEQVRQRNFQPPSSQHRDRKYSLSDDSVSTSGSATTCSI